MAYLDDYSDDERARLTGQQDIGGGAPAASGGGVSAASGSAPKASSGFANLANYFAANQDTAGAQGEQMASGLQGRAESALRSDDPGTAMGVLGELNAGVTPGGLAATANTGSDPNYTAGQAGLDAYLGMRGANPGRFQGLRDLYADRLPKVESAVARPEYREATGNPLSPVVGGGAASPEWVQSVRDYEAWRRRRAENVGETYAPEFDPMVWDENWGR